MEMRQGWLQRQFDAAAKPSECPNCAERIKQLEAKIQFQKQRLKLWWSVLDIESRCQILMIDPNGGKSKIDQSETS